MWECHGSNFPVASLESFQQENRLFSLKQTRQKMFNLPDVLHHILHAAFWQQVQLNKQVYFVLMSRSMVKIPGWVGWIKCQLTHCYSFKMFFLCNMSKIQTIFCTLFMLVCWIKQPILSSLIKSKSRSNHSSILLFWIFMIFKTHVGHMANVKTKDKHHMSL